VYARILCWASLAALAPACGSGSKTAASSAGAAGMSAELGASGGMTASNAGQGDGGRAFAGAGGRAPLGGTSGDGRAGAGAAGAGGSATSGAGAGGSATSGAGGEPSASGEAGAGGAGASGAAGAAGGAGASQAPLSVLVFSKTAGFRHDSIPDGISALTHASSGAGYTLAASEDASVFTDDALAKLDVVVFLSTTGDILDAAQEAAFERFITSGKGFVGIHAAADTEYDWEFYGGLVGAYFREHPDVQPATLSVEAPNDPIMAGVPSPWTRTDEWYAFKTNPRPNVLVLMTLDEASYDPGTATMDGDHPVTWCHEYEGGRSFYTALGHTKESYADPAFVGLLTRAIAWAGGRL
jgi:type 1 glutamine amidotransferase